MISMKVFDILKQLSDYCTILLVRKLIRIPYSHLHLLGVMIKASLDFADKFFLAIILWSEESRLVHVKVISKCECKKRNIDLNRLQFRLQIMCIERQSHETFAICIGDDWSMVFGGKLIGNWFSSINFRFCLKVLNSKQNCRIYFYILPLALFYYFHFLSHKKNLHVVPEKNKEICFIYLPFPRQFFCSWRKSGWSLYT